MRDRFGIRHAGDHTVAEPAEDDRTHPLAMRDRQERRDARAHRIAHDVGALDIEMIEQAARVLGHAVARIIKRGIAEALTAAMATVIDGDDAAAFLHQPLDPAGIEPVDLRRRAEPMDEQDRLCTRLARLTVGNGDAIGGKRLGRGFDHRAHRLLSQFGMRPFIDVMPALKPLPVDSRFPSMSAANNQRPFLAVYALILKGDDILVMLRQNTSYADGQWSIPRAMSSRTKASSAPARASFWRKPASSSPRTNGVWAA